MSDDDKAKLSTVWPLSFVFCPFLLSLYGALNFCCREEKGRRLFERSEFASFPSLRRKFKEWVAISARLSFAYFSLARQRKVSQPRQGMKQEMHHKNKTQKAKKQKIPRGPNLACTAPSARCIRWMRQSCAGNAANQGKPTPKLAALHGVGNVTRCYDRRTHRPWPASTRSGALGITRDLRRRSRHIPTEHA